jgi:phosphatidylglycerophosphatase A
MENISMTGHTLSVRIATLGALGRSPFAPGTVGTVVAGVPGAVIMSVFGGWPSFVLLVLLFLLGCSVSHLAEKELGSKDPGEIVIDELIGFLVTMIWLPVTATSLLLGVAAFRLFDIWKPWPVKVLDAKVGGGLGVVLDDVGAGVLAHALVWIMLGIWP